MSFEVIISLLGGTGLFLFGMRIMGESLERVAGERLKGILAVMTKNKYMALLTGLFVTGAIQSSGATTVMLIGFVNARLISLSQAVGVIMGANIGTTVTSLILSIKIDLGAVFSLAGIFLIFFGKKRQQIVLTGYTLMGLGLIFIGMDMMSAAMTPLRELPEVQDVIRGINHPLIGVLVGVAVTGLMQSSSVSIGIMQVLAASGLVGAEAALYFLLGSNIGSCLPSLIAMSGASIAAKRTAIIHLLFNVIGTIVFLAVSFVLPIAGYVEAMTPGNPKLAIAVMHIGFNVVSTLLLLPFTAKVVKLSTWLIRGADADVPEISLRYYNDNLLVTPAIAAEQLYRETCRMGVNSRVHLSLAMDALMNADASREPEMNAHEELADYLEEKITAALVRVIATEITAPESKKIGNLFHIVNDLERISDHSDNLFDLAKERATRSIPLSDTALGDLKEIYAHVMTSLDIALCALNEWQISDDARRDAEEAEEEVDRCMTQMHDTHLERLRDHACQPKSGVLFLEAINNLERVSDYAMNVTESAAEEGAYVHSEK